MKKYAIFLSFFFVVTLYLSLFSCKKEGAKDENTAVDTTVVIYNDTVRIDNREGIYELDLNGDSLMDIRFYGENIMWPNSNLIFSIIELHPQAEVLGFEYQDSITDVYFFSGNGTCIITSNTVNYCSGDSCVTNAGGTFIYPLLFDTVDVNTLFNFIPTPDSLILKQHTESGPPSFCTTPFDRYDTRMTYGSLASTSSGSKAIVVRLNGTELYAIYFRGDYTFYYEIERVKKLAD